MEDEASRDLPSAVELFRPLRQNVYAILFDFNKRLLIYRNELKNLKGATPLFNLTCLQSRVVRL